MTGPAPAEPGGRAAATPRTALVLVLTSAALLALGGMAVGRLRLGLWAAAPVQFLALLTPSAVWALSHRLVPLAFPFRRVLWRDALRAALLLAGASGVALGAALLLGEWMGERPSEVALRFELSSYPLALRLLLFAGVPALCEEALFRGAVLACLRPWGRWGACLASGALFAALHLDPAKFLPVGFLGVALALAVWETGSLWPAVAGHALHNAVVLALATTSGNPAASFGPGPAMVLLAVGLGAAAGGTVLFLQRPR